MVTVPTNGTIPESSGSLLSTKLLESKEWILHI